MNIHIKSIIKKLEEKPSVLQQDNTRSIYLEENGKRYSTNKVRSGDVVIVYHPTGKLVGDYLTKPLNGTPFKNHCNMIMGVDDKAIEYYRVRYENAKVEYQKCIGY